MRFWPPHQLRSELDRFQRSPAWLHARWLCLKPTVGRRILLQAKGARWVIVGLAGSCGVGVGVAREACPVTHCLAARYVAPSSPVAPQMPPSTALLRSSTARGFSRSPGTRPLQGSRRTSRRQRGRRDSWRSLLAFLAGLSHPGPARRTHRGPCRSNVLDRTLT